MSTKQPTTEYDGSQPLKSGRQELYCQGIISGKSQKQAYIEAGYSDYGSPRQNAHRLSTKEYAIARIAFIRAEIREMADVTQEKQSAKLAWAQQHARENGETSNYIKACEVQNRLYGLDKQVIEQSEQQKQLSKSQSAEAVRLAEIRVREDMGHKPGEIVYKGTGGPERHDTDWIHKARGCNQESEKVPQKATEEPEHDDTEKVYAMDWTNDSQDEDNTSPDGSHRPEQADKEQDGKQALEG